MTCALKRNRGGPRRAGACPAPQCSSETADPRASRRAASSLRFFEATPRQGGSPTGMSFVKRGQAGFTLFELLITMAVISTLVGVGFFAITRGSDDRALERGADMLHSMVRVARTQAITNGVHARLIINADKSDPESYLRRIGVVLEGDERVTIEEDTYDTVLAVERGALLPEGVHIVPQDSDALVQSGFPRSIYRKKNNDASDDTAVYGFKYPMKEPVPVGVSGTSEWICIQFAPNGRLSSATPGGRALVPRSNRLILARGQWSSGKLDFQGAERFLSIAFKLSGASFASEDSALFELEMTDVEAGDN